MTTVSRLRELVGAVRPLGWLLLAVAAVGLPAAALLGWRELALLAAACLVLLLLALPFLLGRTRVEVRLALEPSRIVAGGSVAAAVHVRNTSAARMLPTVLELPVGASLHRYGLPALASGATHEENFTVRTDRRGVIAVGPATTRRGDPLGVCSRDSRWSEVHEVLVRPPLVPLEALGAGLLRDLEGVTTDAVSQSDLAFHALREYVPGDDLRHVHWRSSAKAMASGGESQLLVRQYLDTRRSHATIVVEDDLAAWGDALQREEAFETGMSVAASLIVRAALDEFETSFFCGDHATSGAEGNRALDTVCRAVPGSRGLVSAAQAAAGTAVDTSLLFLLAGARTPVQTLLRAASVFAPEVRRVAVVVDPATTTAGVSEAGGISVLRLAAKEDLPGLLRWSVR
ncbi:DUF58 domain-containing protein [Nocardioides nanhaiensis]|uniref:DUF58 domain-containing protein n=1 Tax=Nocardioides nanhaiensis TaxID=1476871 RepID=A0ABP8VWA4_9ACTN